ncbi:MAG: acyl-ACP--UDP-N-acetylglucosamine O-acyltransferase, partial [Pirellulaceae bacterium]
MDDIFSFEQHAEQHRQVQPAPPQISKLAEVDSRAEIGENVKIGPFCVVGPEVTIGAGTELQNNVTLCGRVTIGEDNRISAGTVIGGEPQDLGYDGTPTEVIIGDRNIIRECVTINRATTKENLVTSMGDDNFLMACVHVAHDCKVGNNVKIANATLLGGHVHVFDHATISGNAGVHHFTRIGAYSFVSGIGRVIQDVPPYLLFEGNPSKPRCVNVVALKRNDFSSESIKKINLAFRLLYRSRVGLDNAREILRGKDYLCREINDLLNFIEYQQDGKHGRGR